MTDESKMVVLNRDAVLKHVALPKELVEIPEWGGSVWVRGLTAGERDEFENTVLRQRPTKKGRVVQTVSLQDARARLAVMSVVDNEGQRLFTYDDVARLSQLSASAVDRIFDVASRLSGMTDEDVDELLGN